MRLPIALSIALVLVAAAADASGPAASVTATVTIAPRTSLQVSTGLLRFVVPDGSSSATADLDFTAAARTMRGEDVLLLAEHDGLVQAVPGGSAPGLALSFAGEGEGTTTGVLPAGVSGVVARWNLGGRRHGRLVLTLQGVAPGTYTIPVRLIVSVP